ncbi:MAG: hypothetical protein WBV77_14775 [Solirubrobacteraceae bacterium]
MNQENLTFILSAIGAFEGTLALLIAIMGVLAALVVVSFVAGLLAGSFIVYYASVRPDT